ncbi:MAG: ATP-grasp domain-containing protein [Propionibacteriaceae bacterium]|nr:ATP-grasp domain-containing protein [Propionibacteriaceae bacterium]
MRIAFILTRRVPDVPSPVVSSAQKLLAEAGHDVTGWIPEDRMLRCDTLGIEADLYVLKSHTELALSYAGAVETYGVPVFNPYFACLLAQDKVTASCRMRQLAVPTPDTWLIDQPMQAEALLADGPLIIKPHRGHRGAGVYKVLTRQELVAVPQAKMPLIAQRYVPGCGEDLKVYVAGAHVWAVRKKFDDMSFTRPGRPVVVDDQVREIVARIRAGFRLELFGCDVIESPDGPQVVDINYFPGYKGCDDPAPRIAESIENFAATL